MLNIKKTTKTDVTVTIPPAKAHTLRALIIAALAKGKSDIKNPLLAEDQLNVIECLKGLGVKIEQSENAITVHGTGGVFSPVADEINVGESGVGANFLTSMCCLADKPIILTGAKRITERPIAEVVNGLRQLGCKIEYLANEGYPPIKIHGGGIKGGIAKMKGAKTSQYFSSIVISAPNATEAVELECADDMTERPYLDISLGMMEEFGIEADNTDYKHIKIPTGAYQGREIGIEGDHSSASFFALAAAICKMTVRMKGLRADTKQGDKEFLELMRKIGCEVEFDGNTAIVKGDDLASIEVDMSDIPDLVPPMAVAAAFAEGTSEFTNIGHLRFKECDRLGVMAEELGKMGVKAVCTEDSLIIEGSAGNIHGAVIDPHNDHRIAMSFGVAGLAVGGVKIENEGCVAKSFPDFWERLAVFL